MADVEQYRANAPSVDDRVDVGRAIEVVRRPVYSPGVAALQSVIPGFGQFYTARPVRGVIALVAVTGATAFAFTQKTTESQVPYVDPNGVPAPYTVTTKERPYFAVAAASAVGLAVLAGIDAIMFANKSQRGASILTRSSSASSTSDALFSIAPRIDLQGRTGFAVSARF